MQIVVRILKDQELLDKQIECKAAELRNKGSHGYFQALKEARRVVSNVDHTHIVNCEHQKKPIGMAFELANGRNFKFSVDGVNQSH